MYAIVDSCGKQYKVSEGDQVFFEKLDENFISFLPILPFISPIKRILVTITFIILCSSYGFALCAKP